MEALDTTAKFFDSDVHPYWFTRRAKHRTALIQALVAQSFMVIFRIFAGAKIDGQEHIREAEEYKRKGGKIIVASNHLSDLDVLLVRAAFGWTSSPLVPLRTVSLKPKHYTNFGPFRRALYQEGFFRFLGAFPAYLGTRDYSVALRTHMRFLNGGETIYIFPEGGCSKNGMVQEGKGGIGFLALESDAAILPITIVGDWRPRPLDFFLRRYRFRVRIGKLITPNELRHVARHENSDGFKRIGNHVMDIIRKEYVDIREHHPENRQVLYERWSVTDFGGEMSRKSLVFTFLTYVVTGLCFFKNNAIILYRKFRTPSLSYLEILWSLGRERNHTSSLFLDGLSHWNHNIKLSAASWHSLEPFYNYWDITIPAQELALESARAKGPASYAKEWIAVRLSRYWMGHSHNRQALRNRLLISIRLLEDAILSIPEDETVRILSVASGSARAVVAAVKHFPNRRFNITLLDADPTALANAKALAQREGVADSFTYYNGTTDELENAIGKDKPHIVEMVGFMDYRPHQKAVALSKRIRKILRDGGIYLCANIQPNDEAGLLTWGLLWPMIYRNTEEYARIMREAGFLDTNVRYIREPFGIHILSVAKKA
jgi:1-acyl-sn-glycerol-3-phosphate acyltransferase